MKILQECYDLCGKNSIACMHDIEPYYKWRDEYVSSEDDESPFHGQDYSEFTYSNKVYNYFIHPQWDEIGSCTLYCKNIFVDYENGVSIIELIGEWNDCINNDIMFLKRNLIDKQVNKGISHFILCCDNVLNFHGSDECYYEEWHEDIADKDGNIFILNGLKHVEEEMIALRLSNYAHMGPPYNDFQWRQFKPLNLLQTLLSNLTKRIDSKLIY